MDPLSSNSSIICSIWWSSSDLKCSWWSSFPAWLPPPTQFPSCHFEPFSTVFPAMPWLVPKLVHCASCDCFVTFFLVACREVMWHLCSLAAKVAERSFDDDDWGSLGLWGKFVRAFGPHISLAASSYARAASSAVSNVPNHILVFLQPKRNTKRFILVQELKQFETRSRLSLVQKNNIKDLGFVCVPVKKTFLKVFFWNCKETFLLMKERARNVSRKWNYRRGWRISETQEPQCLWRTPRYRCCGLVMVLEIRNVQMI